MKSIYVGRFQGRTAIVTGAASGSGKAVAQRIVEEGGRVALWDLNPYGYLFEEITASSLVKIDLQGRKVMDSPHAVNPAGFTIHSAIHAARHSTCCATTAC